MIYFDDIDISIQPKGADNPTGVLAQSCNLSIQNSSREIYSLGRVGPSAISPDGPATATLSINYILESENNPSFFRFIWPRKPRSASSTRCARSSVDYLSVMIF